MDEIKILWSITSILLGALWLVSTFFIKKWINDLERKIDKKAEKETCDKTHEILDKLAHKHAVSGQAGEVIYYEAR